jgi:hypothetical protein
LLAMRIAGRNADGSRPRRRLQGVIAEEQSPLPAA